MVCWFFKFWHYFDLVKRIKFGVSGHFLKNAWREWPEMLHADVSWPSSELISLWPHQMETFSALLAIGVGNSPVTGEFPPQRPEIRSFDVFVDLRPNKRLSKQWWGWWFEMPSCPLWCHCSVWWLCAAQALSHELNWGGKNRGYYHHKKMNRTITKKLMGWWPPNFP